MPHAIALTGPLDLAALRQAMDELVVRHEALRTRLIAGPGGAPIQVIDPPAPVPLPVTDLSALAGPQRQARLRDFIDAESEAPFDLAAGPLLRAALARLGPGDQLLMVVVHHVVFDGWSGGVLIRDLTALYAAAAAGESPVLAPLPVQFADYALWERQRLHGQLLTDLQDYWRQRLDGFEIVQFPTDRPRPVLDSFEGASARHRADAALLTALRELSRREGTTLFVTLMAALQALLHRYTGQTDVVVGTFSANRSRAELAPLAGFLVNTLPIRADLSGDPAFTELLAQVRQTTVSAYSRQELPFGKLVEALGVPRDASRAPVVQIVLTSAERDSTPVRAAGVDFLLTDLVLGTEAAKFDLGFLVEARADGLWFCCWYKTALFDASTIERLLGHFEVLLRGVVGNPAARLSELPVLTEAELHRELTEWNDTAAPVRLRCVHEGFGEQVTRTPGAVAAEFEGESWSYAQLNARANQIARRLRAAGVGPEALVGVCMPAGLARLAGLLGIWKAGGGYVPLDPALPTERLAFMMTDTQMQVLLTDDRSLASARAAVQQAAVQQVADAVTVLSLDALPADANADDLTGVPVTPENVAYVLYTSGSTGRPKGVLVEHRQVINLVHGMIERWQVAGSDAVLQFASFTFDVSVLDMFVPLLAGARLVLAAAETLHSPPRLTALLRGRRVTLACLPPAVLSLIADQQFPDLRMLMAAGEELPADLVRRWVRPGLTFVNGYGPTEATVIATYQELDATMIPPPIGLPTWPNYRGYVLDEGLRPVPVGVAGELHLGGAGVARGYLNRPELTRERFIPDPFTPGGRLYKTGDLVRRRGDGLIVYLGRMDSQVKIRGLRIELGEIEAALARCPGVAQAVAVLVADQAGERQLAGYLRPVPGAVLSVPELRDQLARLLPAYMIPVFLVLVDEFTLNASGKVDKSRLPAPQDRRERALVPPATLIETVLAGWYATLLGHEEVGATDRFFDLGGNSLQAMRLISLMNDELEVDIGVAPVFLAPTPRQLAALLRDEHGLADEELGADGIAGLDGMDELDQLAAGNLGAVGDGS